MRDHASDEFIKKYVGLCFSSGFLFFVVDDQNKPVSMMCLAGEPTCGLRISQVYTPKECRRKGYASKGVRVLCQRLLAGEEDLPKLKRVYLFADRANSSSNKIYQEIGFEHVMDNNNYKFISKG